MKIDTKKLIEFHKIAKQLGLTKKQQRELLFLQIKAIIDAGTLHSWIKAVWIRAMNPNLRRGRAQKT